MSGVVLSVEDLTKGFPGVVALDGVSFELRRGEIHALLGENGAGKSTLVKILTGVHPKDAGVIRLDGKSVAFATPADAYDAGLQVVFQEFSQVGTLSVAENIYLGEWPKAWGCVDWRRLNRDAVTLLRRFALDVDPRERLADLGVATRQMVEIIKGCRSAEVRVLILDEPTSALSETETERLFGFLRSLRASGVAIVYISHRLGEIERICDRVTVLRNGRNVMTAAVGAVTMDQIVASMVGRDLGHRFPPKQGEAGAVALKVERMTTPKLREVSLEAHRGEVLGIAGLVGAGKTELLRAIFGADPTLAGAVSLHGKRVLLADPKRAVAAGLGLIPEARKEQALVLTASSAFNASLAALKSFARPLLSRRKERAAALRLIEQLQVKPLDPDAFVATLSGGNQQKIVLARWLMTKSAILLFDEPTRGIDVGAKYQIYTLIGDLAKSGHCLVVASSDVDELAGICHRVLVLAEGKLVAEIRGDTLTEENLLRATTRGKEAA